MLPCSVSVVATSRTMATFDQFGGSMDADGFQVGVYGAYDPGTFYIKAAVELLRSVG